MAYLLWNDKRLLCAYDGLRPEPVFVWTYSDFERHLTEYITPSMYHFMTCHVMEYISDTCLVSIQRGEYISEGLEAEAVDAYFGIPIQARINMHEQELVNLAHEKKRAEDKYTAVLDYLLDDATPFDPTSPIYYKELRSLVDKYGDEVQRLEQEYQEEMQWVGGHEQGAEDFF